MISEFRCIGGRLCSVHLFAYASKIYYQIICHRQAESTNEDHLAYSGLDSNGSCSGYHLACVRVNKQ